MRYLLAFLTLLLISASAAAQEATPEAAPEGWQVVERCVDEPTTPPEGWSWEGVIFTLTRGDGLHALRADVETPYYVAFDSQSEFAVSGALSPDGQWFAVPAGRVEYGTWASDDFVVDELRVYSTTPSREMFRIDWDYLSSGLGVSGSIPEVVWIDNQHFLYPFGFEGSEGIRRINSLTGVAEPYENPNPYLETLSPDGTRVVHYESYDHGNSLVGSLQEANSRITLRQFYSGLFLYDVAWLPDSSRFITSVNSRRMPEGNTVADIALLDRDGNITDVILVGTGGGRYAVPANGDYVAINVDNQIYVVNLTEEIVIDPCLPAFWDAEVSWSPDSRFLALIYRGNEGLNGEVAVLDLTSSAVYGLNYVSTSVIGWYPLE